MLVPVSLLALSLSSVAAAHSSHQTPLTGPLQKLWYNTLPGDGGTQVRALFSAYPLSTPHPTSNEHDARPTLSSPASRPSAASPTFLVSRAKKRDSILRSSVRPLTRAHRTDLARGSGLVGFDREAGG
jgi:hypothetical protein